MSVFASGFCENFYGFQHFHSVYSTSLNRLIMVELEIFQVIFEGEGDGRYFYLWGFRSKRDNYSLIGGIGNKIGFIL